MFQYSFHWLFFFVFRRFMIGIWCINIVYWSHTQFWGTRSSIYSHMVWHVDTEMTVMKEVFTHRSLEAEGAVCGGRCGDRASQRWSQWAENTGENLSRGFRKREQVAQDERGGVWLRDLGTAPHCLIPGWVTGRWTEAQVKEAPGFGWFVHERCACRQVVSYL